MEVVAPSTETLNVLRALARGGFAYDATKTLGALAGWELQTDEPDQSFLQFLLRPDVSCDERRLASVMVSGGGDRRFGFLPLYLFDESNAPDRQQFDASFDTIAVELVARLGSPTASGKYVYPHRPGWNYSFAGWMLLDATLILVQDEYDIQFGMDVTLWVFPAGSPATAPINVN